MMGRQSSLIRTLALINGNALSKFNATAFGKKSSAKLSRGFAEKVETKSAEKLKAVVFQPEVQQKQRKKQDIFTEAGVTLVPSLRLKEAVALGEALGYDVVLSDVIQLKQFYRGSFFGKVKLEEIKQLVDQNKANALIINHKLNYIQESKLRELFPDVKIFDRAGAFLEILSQRAQTRNAKLHIELAALKEKKRSVIQLYEADYEPDGNPLAGVPETKWQVQWRAVLERERKVMRELDEMKNQKIEERQQRQKLPIIACVGYTNSGKSTLVNRLAGAQLPTGPQPFSVLEPTIVSYTLPGGAKAVIMDTVGFIGELYEVLSYSFRNTLDEILLSDVLLHVRDIAHPESEYQKANVQHILKRLYLGDHLSSINHIEVWNKTDLVDKGQLNAMLSDSKISTPVAPLSAKTGEGVDALAARIEKIVQQWKSQGASSTTTTQATPAV